MLAVTLAIGAVLIILGIVMATDKIDRRPRIRFAPVRRYDYDSCCDCGIPPDHPLGTALNAIRRCDWCAQLLEVR